MQDYKPLLNLKETNGDSIFIHVDQIVKISQIKLNNQIMYQVKMIDGTFAHVEPSNYSKFLEFCKTA